MMIPTQATQLPKMLLFAAGMAVLAAGLPAQSFADAYLSADVMSLSTNARVDGGFALGNTTSTAGHYLLPYYLRVHFPASNFTAWGIQLYTNNSPNRAWNPPDGIYGGLRGAADPQVRVPLYWQVYDTPQSVTTTVGGLAFYDDRFRGHTLHCWGLVRDRNDTDMANWLEYSTLRKRTLVSYEGFGDYPAPNRPCRTSPVYVYLGIDVSQVRTTDSFGTVLNLDLYNLGVDISSGGYATPNPFTPATGQRTSFNFFLKDINSRFEIKIFTIRGRCIRTINDVREWDGRGDNGQLVEGGLYIYQITADGQRVSGTVVLIK